GKGTQAARIAREYEIPHIATGDMFRAAIASDSELGRQVVPYLAEGRLVPDELTVSLIRERLGQDDARDGFVLDGFPRNLTQAEALDEMLAEIGRGLSVVLALQVPDAVARARLLAAGRARPDRRRVHSLARRHPDLQGVPRLPGLDLRVPERDGRPRHSRPVRAGRGGRALGGRRRHARRLRRRLRLDVSGRRHLAEGRAAARGLRDVPVRRDRAGPGREPALGII